VTILLYGFALSLGAAIGVVCAGLLGSAGKTSAYQEGHADGYQAGLHAGYQHGAETGFRDGCTRRRTHT
jgi:hypothetical protein